MCLAYSCCLPSALTRKLQVPKEHIARNMFQFDLSVVTVLTCKNRSWSQGPSRVGRDLLSATVQDAVGVSEG